MHQNRREHIALRSERTQAELAARLREVGQRVTPQRLVILGAFGPPGDHLTADEIFAAVERFAPAINRSTVYRTLELFRDIGLISETDLGGGVRQYELLEHGRHHHLICRDCGEMVEVDDALIEPLRQAARERYHFEPCIEHLALFGWCAGCAATRQRGGDDTSDDPVESQ
ncbi:MAG TPA: Fur family transcriptional regulator [Thermomicrobiales bacterium]|nr:Fur family transcriptional regulator [Thermomicrobiales bacterium]